MNIQLQSLDWCIIAFFFLATIFIGVVVSKRSSRSEEEFFLGGRGMPWYLLGFSMVATTFSTDTPNLVTDIVRSNGVFGNWVWWCMLPSGMLTAFLYARLWRRLGGDRSGILRTAVQRTRGGIPAGLPGGISGTDLQYPHHCQCLPGRY